MSQCLLNREGVHVRRITTKVGAGLASESNQSDLYDRWDSKHIRAPTAIDSIDHTTCPDDELISSAQIFKLNKIVGMVVDIGMSQTRKVCIWSDPWITSRLGIWLHSSSGELEKRISELISVR